MSMDSKHPRLASSREIYLTTPRKESAQDNREIAMVNPLSRVRDWSKSFAEQRRKHLQPRFEIRAVMVL